MSSRLRTLQRRALRKRADYTPAGQPTKVFPDGGYRTLRPTKGWLVMSARRLLARLTVAAITNHDLPERVRKLPKVWREPAPVPPSTETRQQRRHAARKATA